MPRLPLACALALILLSPRCLTGQLTWAKDPDLNAGLPPQVEVFETFDDLGDGAPNHAVYVRAPLTDSSLQFIPVMVPEGEEAKTPLQFADDELAASGDSVYVTINGGFFSPTESVSLVIRAGELLAPNVRSVVRGGQRYQPTRGAFGIYPDRQADVAWVYSPDDDTTFAYPLPSPNERGSPPQPTPSADFPPGAMLWGIADGIGGTPVLVAGDSIHITREEELIQLGLEEREPRTAIGYTADGDVVLLVVDGRWPGFAAGATLPELARIMLDLGCREALNLDGGGSTAMVVRGKTLNFPSDLNGMRPVRSVFMVKKRDQVVSTASPGGKPFPAPPPALRLRLAPNPASGAGLDVRVEGVRPSQALRFDLYSSQGAWVASRTLRLSAGRLHFDLPPSLPDGLYLLRVVSPRAADARLFVLQR